jgi:hypothetical protein
MREIVYWTLIVIRDVGIAIAILSFIFFLALAPIFIDYD